MEKQWFLLLAILIMPTYINTAIRLYNDSLKEVMFLYQSQPNVAVCSKVKIKGSEKQGICALDFLKPGQQKKIDHDSHFDDTITIFEKKAKHIKKNKRHLPTMQKRAPFLGKKLGSLEIKNTDIKIYVWDGATLISAKKIIFEPKRARVIDIGGEDKKDIIQSIKKSSLFENNKSHFLNRNTITSLILGSITLPRNSTYNLGSTLLQSTKSSSELENIYGSVPTLATIPSYNNTITFIPKKPKQFPTLTINMDKNKNTLRFSSRLRAGNASHETFDLNAFMTHLQNKGDIATDKGYVFFAGFPLQVYLNITINKNGKSMLKSITIQALYNKFWHIAHGPYKRPPQRDYSPTFSRSTLKKAGALKIGKYPT